MPTCPVCHGQYAESELLGRSKRRVADVDALRPLSGRTLLCPRCQSDIYSWRKKEEQERDADKIKSMLSRFYPLIIPLLALVLWFAGRHPHLVGSLLAIILSVVPFLIMKNNAPAYRIAKWARPLKAKPGLSLETVELGTFIIGLAMALVTLVLMEFWDLPSSRPAFVEKLVTSLVYSLSFVLITIALTGMMINAQIRELDKTRPQPIFTDTARLLEIALKSATEQLDLQDTPTVESVERTDDAGIRVVVSLRRKVTEAEKKYEITETTEKNSKEPEVSSKRKKEEKIAEKDEKGSVARWAIKADMWGRIRSIDVRDWWTFVQ